ncbi:hypothetical protein OV079_25590 [Nannocystis pusilla]|uniref:VWFA domain-containing protein n=1 Tax=Nannocystis pusilla TaxID=889268 RepID=A0A9X3ERA1_9BACT|nr:hypothetical protein [Nannocystis pusilla]MCY1008869.1 hypothetical protein [Nannocystis pusilla]
MKKPLLLFVLDYSTSMNSPFSGNQTRWEAAVDALVDTLEADEDLLADQLQIGVLRFGHDPDPGAPGTAIAGDASGLLDGQHLDLGVYDPLAPDKAYLQCNGDAVKDALLAVQSPLGGQLDGIESWTGGALARAQAYLQQTAADHPLDLDTRDAAIVLVTDGPWTDPSGTTPLAPATADPALVAADIFNNMSVRTYVLALGEAADEPWADAIGVAGGTGPARLGLYPTGLRNALGAVVDDFSTDVRLPRCSPAMARAMVLLDASSSMLNINGGTQAGPMGATGWDQVRDALSGFSMPLFERPALASTREHFTLFGLAVFGHHEPAPGEQKLLVDYGLCHRPQFDWALDPETSCEPPGCTDPWGGPPLTWTFKTGDQADPPFAESVVSHMPRCDLFPNNPQACTGSGTHLHLGLQLVHDHFTAYKAACLADDAAMPCADATPFINVVIVDGAYNSSDAAVQAPLAAMHAAGVTTRVIGFGDIVGTPQPRPSSRPWRAGARAGSSRTSTPRTRRSSSSRSRRSPTPCPPTRAATPACASPRAAAATASSTPTSSVTTATAARATAASPTASSSRRTRPPATRPPPPAKTPRPRATRRPTRPRPRPPTRPRPRPPTRSPRPRPPPSTRPRRLRRRRPRPPSSRRATAPPPRRAPAKRRARAPAAAPPPPIPPAPAAPIRPKVAAARATAPALSTPRCCSRSPPYFAVAAESDTSRHASRFPSIRAKRSATDCDGSGSTRRDPSPGARGWRRGSARTADASATADYADYEASAAVSEQLAESMQLAQSLLVDLAQLEGMSRSR